MSLAGVRSSRGDAYQVCVAMEWAIQMIKDVRINWMELDSTRLIASGVPVPVDDLIVGWNGGDETCFQCKKNQPGYEAWTVDDLEDDLKKAAVHLVADPHATVRFCSRGDFGDLARLADRARQMPDLASFMTGLPKNLEPQLNKLKAAWNASIAAGTHDAHSLLVRISFDLTPSVDDYPSRLKIDLAQIVTHVDDAFAVLWTTLDNLGARTGTSGLIVGSHRITREEVLHLLRDKGCAVAPPRAQAEVAAKLSAMSKIGRAWMRETSGRRFEREAVEKLVTAAEAKSLVLLTDGPGAGKTCVILNLVEKLEAKPGISTLFLQAREFADATNHDGRVALGLDPDVPALVSAMSQWMRVVVVIDSLDVLSLSRESESLAFFLSLIDRLAAIPNVCVVVACRSFDLRFNKKLAGRTWDETVEAGLLDWSAVVAPLLTDLMVDVASVDETTKLLLRNPRNLVLYTDIAARSKSRNVSGAQELVDSYLDVVVASDVALGSAAMIALEEMAGEMLTRRRHQIPRSRVKLDDETLLGLCSLNVVMLNARNAVGFGHQTLLDALAVRSAIRQGLTLLEFIQSLQPVPFVRPTIRAYFAHLLLGDRTEFRVQVRAVFDSDAVAFHIKRLIADAYAAGEPDDADWSLVRHLFQTKIEHFRSIYEGGQQLSWHYFWMRFFVPLLQSTGDVSWLEVHVQKVREWADADPKGVFAFWAEFAASKIAEGRNIRTRLGIALSHFSHLDKVDAQALLERLLESPASGHDFLAKPLVTWAEIDSRGDSLLWRYVTTDVPRFPEYEHQVDEALHGDETGFRGPGGLGDRLATSMQLLDMAVSCLESWGASIGFRQRSIMGPVRAEPNNAFLDETTFYITHSRHQMRHSSTLDTLVRAIEASVLNHAAAHDVWWQANGRRICLNMCGGLRYMGVLAMTRSPDANAALAEEFFEDEGRLRLADPFELGNLISAVAPFLGDALDSVERHILGRHEALANQGRRWVEAERYGLLQKIPSWLRSSGAAEEIERMEAELAPPNQEPEIFSTSGSVTPPFSQTVFASLSDEGVVKLLRYSQGLGEGPIAGPGLIGGTDSVDRLLHTVSSEQPRRFLKILTDKWVDLPKKSRLAIFEGAGNYLRFRYGNVSASHWKPIEDMEAAELIQILLTELERHPTFWPGTREGASVVRGLAHVTSQDDDVRRLAFLAPSHLAVEDPKCDERLGDDLIGTAINSARGDLAEGLLVMSNRQLEAGHELPELLPPTLLRLARDCHPAVRALLIRELAFLQSKTELGWQLFDAAFSDDDQRVWVHAETPLYYCTGKQFVRAAPYLDRMEQASVAGVLKAWGRLSALFVLDNQIALDLFLEKVARRNDEAAWSGAISVWVANANNSTFSADCFRALEAAAGHAVARPPFLRKLGSLLRAGKPVARVPMSLLRAAYIGDATETSSPIPLAPQLDEWLCELVEIDPDQALEIAEIVAGICKVRDASPFYDATPLGTLLTALFREAEEREISDGKAMLGRVVALQDIFLSLPASTLDSWLRAAERPDK